ncbi:MAG: hypothetical protein ACTHMZ_11840 [Actinomycetes bacterium]
MSVREDLERELRRVRDRIAGLTLTQLQSGAPTRAELARQAAQRIADLDAEAEGAPRRPLPELSPFALADQLAVVTTDLLTAADQAAVDQAAPDQTAIDQTATEGAAPEETLLNDALEVLVELRRAL